MALGSRPEDRPPSHEQGDAGEPFPETAMLVVDDEADTLESVITVIEAAFPTVRVHGASNGFDALELLRRTSVELIMSDHKMPQMSGVHFLTEAAKIAPEAPRILMTAYADLNVAVKAINEAHVTSFFLKPLQVEILIEAVSQALGIEPLAPGSRDPL